MILDSVYLITVCNSDIRVTLFSVCLQYPLMVIMLISGDISQLISLTSFSHWFFIALATLGMLIHRYRFPLHPRPFKVSILY